MMENYTYSLLTSQHTGAINALFHAAFGTPPKEAFVRWKYFSNPAGDAILAGAFCNGQLVGSGAMIPENMNVYGQEKLIFKCTDLMTHPDHQRKGLSKKINELLYQETLRMGTPFSYTLCSKTATKSFLKNNWLFLDEVINLFKPYALLKLTSLFRQNDTKAFDFFDSIGDTLCAYHHSKDSSLISIKKSPAYLQWRTSNPDFSYKLICSYSQEKQINGYLIYSISPNNLLNIIDIEAADGDSKILEQLLLCVEHIAVTNQHKGILGITIKNSPLFKFLRSNHYIYNPFKKGPLTTQLDFDIYLYDKDSTTTMNTSHWNINGLSYDDI